jgi:ribosomal protein S1
MENNNHFRKLLKNSTIDLQGFKGRLLKTTCYDLDSKKGKISLDMGHKMSTHFSSRLLKESAIKDLKTWKVGDEKVFFINQMETRDGDLILNPPQKFNYNPSHSWKAIVRAYENDQFIMGRILNTVKGGLSVGIGGFVAFLPNSQLLKGHSPSYAHWLARIQPFIGCILTFKLLKVTNKTKKNVVLSRKAALKAFPPKKKI